MIRSLILCIILLIPSLFTSAQDKIAIDDRVGLLSPELEEVIGGKLKAEGLTLTQMVDFTKRCEYFFSALKKTDGDLIVVLNDCEQAVLGEKNLGSGIFSAPPSEQGILITYALMDMVRDPGKYVSTAPATIQTPVTEGAPPTRRDSAYADEHNTRYFFAPSAYNLKKGEAYYNTIYFLIHDIQFGITDNFSLGMGTTIIGLPLYFTPKLSIPVGNKSALGIGDMLMLGTWGSDFLGNLAYGTFSSGGRNGNFTVGAGYLYTNENDLTGQTSSMVTNLSAMTRLSPFIFLLTENYVMSANFNKYASYYSNVEPYDYIEEEFVQRNTFWYGILGIRIVTRSRDYISWSAGLTYIVNFPGSYPQKYDSPGWQTDVSSGVRMVAFPTVGFTVKFGNR